MSDYKQIIAFTLGWEGGVAKLKEDKGGLTNKGLTYATYRLICGDVFGIEPTKEHFFNLTDEQIGLVIKYFFDIATNKGAVKSQKVAEALFNWYWGSGRQGLIWFQKMVNECFNGKLLTDGNIGNITTAKINSIDENLLFRSAIQYRKARFEKICKDDPSQIKFLNGWLNRLKAFAKKHNELEYFLNLK